MGSAHFDLRHRDWIPVVDGGAVRLVGLRELFVRAHEIEDLAVPAPPVEAGLWRILYAITARITELDSRCGDRLEWARRRGELVSAEGFTAADVDGYFDAYPDRWDLFDAERPWGQDPRLREQCPKSAGVNKLAFSRPAGQNQVWFGHFMDGDPVALPTAEAAWFLIAQLYFGAAGRCGSRTVAGQSAADTKAGPLRGTVSFHPLGRTLFESLLVGLPAPDSNDDFVGGDGDVCPWERDELPHPLGKPASPGWPGGLLTGRSRAAVLLVPDESGDQVVDAYLTWAWRQDAVPARDPYVIQRLSKQNTWYDQPANASRAVWRDLDALLRKTRPGSTVDRPPVFTNLEVTLPPAVESALRVRALGFDQERAQAKDRQWFSGTTPPVLDWLEARNEAGARVIARANEAAELVGRRLRAELTRAWEFVTSPPSRDNAPGKKRKDKDQNAGPWAARAEPLYWARAETIFWDIAYAGDPADSPIPKFVRLAQEIVDEVMAAQNRLRVAKAATRARRGLARLIKKPDSPGGEETAA